MSDEEKMIDETSFSDDVTLEGGEKKKREKKPKSKVRVALEWVFTAIFAVLFVIAGIGQINAMINRKANYNQNLPYGYGSFVVKTDSMEPKYKVNSAIITHKDKPETILKNFAKPNVGVLISNEDGIKVYSALWKSAEDNKKYGYIDMTFMDVYTTSFKAFDREEFNFQTTATGMPMTHRLREIHVKDNPAPGEDKYVFIAAGINTESEHQSAKGQYQAFSHKQILGVVVLGSTFLGGFFGFISSPWGLLLFLLIPAFYLVITSVLDIFKTMKEPDEEVENASDAGNNKSEVTTLNTLSKEDRERLKREMLDEMMNKKGK